jgi:hypothetical protein
MQLITTFCSFANTPTKGHFYLLKCNRKINCEISITGLFFRGISMSFFKGVEKTNEYGETINPENHIFNKKIIHCLLLLGRILPQLKI